MLNLVNAETAFQSNQGRASGRQLVRCRQRAIKSAGFCPNGDIYCRVLEIADYQRDFQLEEQR